MGVNLEDLTVLRVDYIWLSAEITAEKLCSTVLAVHYAKGKPFDDAIQMLNSELTAGEPPDSDYPEGATEEDRYLFDQRYTEHLREQVEALEDMEVNYSSHLQQQSSESVTIDISALQEIVDTAKRKRRIGFAPE